jgi:class 3 adenylate cyclase
VCGFSKHCVEMPAQMVVEELQRFFRGFERCCQKYKIEPLRAQGDGVIAIGGLWPEAHGHQRQPVIDAVLAALEFRRLLSTDDAPVDPHGEAAAANLWSARIGIHIGPVVMGVIDGVRLSFDVWGDTVNMAARLEQGACRNSIMLSERALWATRGLFDHGPIGPLQVKDSHLPAVAEVFGIAGPYRTSAGEPNAAFWEVYHAAQFAPIRPPVNGSAAVDGVPVSYRLPGSA